MLLVELLAFGSPLAVLVLRKGRGILADGVPRRRLTFVLAPVLGVGAALVSVTLQAFVKALTGMTEPDGMHDLLGAATAGELVLAVLTFCVVAPVLEEALIRGALCRLLADEGKPGVAVGISTLVFVLVHPVPVAWPTYAWLGALLATWRFTCGAWGPCILAHAAFNTCALAVSRFPAVSEGLERTGPTGLALMIGGLAVGLVMRWTLRADRG